jgi:hypothetical protein
MLGLEEEEGSHRCDRGTLLDHACWVTGEAVAAPRCERKLQEWSAALYAEHEALPGTQEPDIEIRVRDRHHEAPKVMAF